MNRWEAAGYLALEEFPVTVHYRPYFSKRPCQELIIQLIVKDNTGFDVKSALFRSLSTIL